MRARKLYFTLVCIVLLLLGLSGLATQVFAQIAGANLIAHYKLDENAGTVVPSEVNSPAADGTFGTPPDDPTWETSNIAPIPGNVAVLHLDDDFDTVLLDPATLQPSGGFTIAVWINVEGLSTNCAAADQIFFIGNNTLTSVKSLIRLAIVEGNHPLAGQVAMSVFDDASSGVTIRDPSAVVIGQWVHYATTFNATTGELKLYRDAVEVASSTLVSFAGFTLPAGHSAEIGDDSSCAGSMQGFVDDLALWDITLTQQQINDVVDQGVSGMITVEIDIKPGSDPNSINLCSNGAVPIAILGSDTFDVNDVNTETLRFAEASVKVVGKKDPHSLCSYEDVNGDFITDLVCHFVTTDIAGIDGESTSATLNGELLDGRPIQGTDSVNIVKDTCN